jgi:predicted MPP superfamily phosphohydrolase
MRMKMKIRVCSDLHLETCEQGFGIPDLGAGDVLILGGDILCARHFKKDGPLHKVYDDFLQKCVKNFDEVLYIQGNHEAYSFHYDTTFKVLKEHLPSSIHLLENDFVKIKDTIFLGCTLWTDFRNENALEMMEASRFLNDYKTIRIGSNYRKLNPDDTLKFHKKSKQFLIEKLEQFKNDKVWILTHHSPSYQSIHPKYRMETTNSSYASNLDDLILENPQVKYFSHGHTHSSFRYKIGECEVICNPRGYYSGVNSSGLNLDFDPNFEIEI